MSPYGMSSLLGRDWVEGTSLLLSQVSYGGKVQAVGFCPALWRPKAVSLTRPIAWIVRVTEPVRLSRGSQTSGILPCPWSWAGLVVYGLKSGMWVVSQAAGFPESL